jgi:hypothetical protein
MNKLTPYQKRTLEFYLAHKDKNLTIVDMWLFNARTYILNLAIYSVAVLLCYAMTGSGGAVLAAAALAGAYLRDLVISVKAVRNWPLLKEITDWEKAASLLENVRKNAQ